jgi:hypothetical protein
MVPSVDNRKYALDTRKFSDVVINDKIFKAFIESPISDLCLIKDVCIYKTGDTNKNGKIGKTSWDSFSYAIQMGHNVWMHINAVQEANRQYDLGKLPSMLVDEKFDRVYYKDIVEAIFSTSDRGTADAVVEEYSRYWDTIIGTRGNTGKRITNAHTYADRNFDIDANLVKDKPVITEQPKPILNNDLFEF